MRTVKVGTRRSALAIRQAHCVIDLLSHRDSDHQYEMKTLTTTGDMVSGPLSTLGTVGLFTRELERALREFEIDIAVHSLKDLPTVPSDGLTVGAICLREDARDVLVSNGVRLNDLPHGARVGTSSPRRMAQLRSLRSDLCPEAIRGNVDTRVAKVQSGEYDAAVVAAAGLHRLGRNADITEYFPVERFLPAPGQGALAVQCRTSDAHIGTLLAAIDEPLVRAVTDAERAFLAALEGGCTAPVGAYGLVDGDDLILAGIVVSLDGLREVRLRERGPIAQPASLGQRCAELALGAGAGELVS